MRLTRGQKARLAELANTQEFQVGVSLDFRGQGGADVSCFGVDQDGRLSDDRYFIFYNQPASPEGAIRMLGPASGDAERFALDLARLPQGVRRLVFAAAVDGPGVMSRLSAGCVRLLAGNEEFARFELSGEDFAQEKAIILLEVYFKDVWRVAAVGQGFSGGLGALLAHFGGEELKSRTPSPSPEPAPAKVVLEKRGDRRTVSLEKPGSPQPIRVNLNWTRKAVKRGIFGAKAKEADLDLGCMVEMQDGWTDVIQALGDSFGSVSDTPYIRLDKDDRSGASDDGENLVIMRPDLIKRVLVFAFIYEGTARFSDVEARVSVTDALGNQTVVGLDNPAFSDMFCAVCLIENTGGSIGIVKEERYFKGHKQADKHYRFGFTWTTGSK
ncbi:General stress protein 16U [Fundidesulfovibrio magnetotacticus]|uniref:General stress protein 16U n=1 Tax=Fundidesulfovibrio magnetotacticus TaxID=2730080 RepID=A0A6V8LZ55_9BACT|nr:TerD family protein [Fundidesulfovibrio magnetotacticus]GFK95299.1 General stress protein 16U [Fundidesulfovibrio magnetotacticus]